MKNSSCKQITNEENWKVFDNSTKAGRLLSRLYGVSSSNQNPCIQYPKLKTKKFDPNRQTWKVAGTARNNKSNSFNCKNKRKQIQVPRVGVSKRDQYHSNIAFVDIIPKRKNAYRCQEQLTRTEEMITAYRPPHHKCLAEKEKVRLTNVFTYKGGSALPAELIHPMGTMPEEEIWIKKENDRVQIAKAKRRAELSGSESFNNATEINSNKDQTIDGKHYDLNAILIQQITKEIEERRIFQRQMDEANCGDKTRDQIANEISSRIIQLEKLNLHKTDEILFINKK